MLEAELKNTTLATVTKHKKKVEKGGSNEIRKEISCDGTDLRNRYETVEQREIVMRILAGAEARLGISQTAVRRR